MGSKKFNSKKRKSATKGWGDENLDNYPGPEDLKEELDGGGNKRPVMTQKRQEAFRRQRRRQQDLAYERNKTARFAQPEVQEVFKRRRRKRKPKSTMPRVLSDSGTDSAKEESEKKILTEAETYAALVADLQKRQNRHSSSELGKLLAFRKREQLGRDESSSSNEGSEADTEDENGTEKIELTEQEYQQYQKDHAGEFKLLKAPEGTDISTMNGADGSEDGSQIQEDSADESDSESTGSLPGNKEEEDGLAAGSSFAQHFLKRICPKDDNVAKPRKLRSLKRPGTFQYATIGGNPLPDKMKLSSKFGIKSMLCQNWKNVSGQYGFSTLQEPMFPVLHQYWDLFYAAQDYLNVPELRQAYLLHVLNHLLQARNLVLKHNKLLRKKANDARSERKILELEAAVEGKKLKPKDFTDGDLKKQEELEDRIKDQGYTRPKVLILLPMRNSALKVMEMMLELLGPNTSVSNLDRFQKEFGVEAEDEDEDQRKSQDSQPKKPADWEATFEGNFDDDFKLGVSITPGQGKGKGPGKGCAIKLYSEFYNSDIIIASPLGLYLTIGPEGEAKRDYDFLSSIEVAVIDQADVMLMQNWSHVQSIMSLLNQIPQQDHNTDFSRVREYFLQGQARVYRQTLLFSNFQDPMLLNLFNTHCSSIAGKMKVKPKYESGSICRVALTVKQIFQRIECDTFQEQDDARFQYFSEVLLPKLLVVNQAHTLIFIPSYFDFVRIRNFLLKKEASFVSVHEYARKSEVSRGRAWFFHGKKAFMLYTGRMHHSQRLKIRGAHHLIFYSIPEYSIFYPELVNLLEEANSSGKTTTCISLFSNFEKFALERVIGSKRCNHILQSSKSAFLFY